MPANLRRYLLDRFTTDASTLRERAAQLRASAASVKGKRVAGPDADTSLRMAGACDDVVSVLAALPEHGALPELLETLRALAVLLDARAAGSAHDSFVRSVYAGAATRLREVARAESTDAAGANGARRLDHQEDDDE